MLSKSRLRRLLPGGRRKNRKEEQIQAIPISEERMFLDDESVNEMPSMYPTQQQCVSSINSFLSGSHLTSCPSQPLG